MQTPHLAPPVRVERVAHRGANRLRTENTLSAFELAIDQGADGVELDVHATADGVVVVHHDADVADGVVPVGRRRAIAGMTWEHARNVVLRGDEHMARLDDILELCAGRVRVYVEIKGADIERSVVETIRRSAADCAVHSFDHAAIARVAALDPGLPRGLLFDKGPTRILDVAAIVERYGARDLWPHHSLVNARFVTAAHEAGARVVSWTVNDPAQARAFAAMGVDALCTDDVPLIERALGAA